MVFYRILHFLSLLKGVFYVVGGVKWVFFSEFHQLNSVLNGWNLLRNG